MRREGAGKIVNRGFLLTSCTDRRDSCFCCVGDNFKDQVNWAREGGVLWPTNFHGARQELRGMVSQILFWFGVLKVSACGAAYLAFTWRG